MRNLKRALSLALASVMVLSMMVIGAGAASYDDFSDKDKIVNKEAVQMLVELGVINGKDTGDFDPTGIVTRAEMAKMICVVLNGGKDPSLGSTVTNSYTDTVGHWAAGYIEYCTQLGIVAGDGAGKFNPNVTVTGSEAAKMLLVALGYKSEVEGFTGANWAIGVNVRANQKGLYSDLTISVDEGLTRDSAAQMIYNALDAGVVSYDYTLVTDGSTISSSPTLIDNNKKTLLEDKFNAVKVEGVVVANEVANLSAKSEKGASLDEGKTSIAITNDDDQSAYAGTKTFAVSTGMDDLGRAVVVYVKKDSNSTKAEVLGAAITSADNKVVVDTSKDSIADVADDNDLTINGETQVAANYGNLVAYSKYTDPKTAGVEKILIDTDADGDVDYVLMNTYAFGKVTTYTTAGDGSIAVSAGTYALSADDKDDVVGFDDVAKNDYVMAAYIGGDLHVAKAETVVGMLEAYKASGSVATKLTVDGTDYNVSNIANIYTGGEDDIAAAKGYGANQLDNEATFYLDKNGLVVAVGNVSENAYKYALVMATGTSIDERVKVALSDGTTGTYVLNDSGNGLGLTGSTKVEVGGVYAYTINSDKEIKLTTAAGGTSYNNATFTKGKTSVGGNSMATVYANKNTAFFYTAGASGSPSVIDDVDVYTGYNNAPTLKAGAKVQVFTSGTRVVAVVFTGSDLTSANLDDNLYLYSVGTSTAKYTNGKAFIAGSTEPVDIKMDSKYSTGVYTYTINSDGYYELKSLPTGYNTYSALDSDDKPQFTVATATNDNFVIGNDEFTITSKTLLVDDSAYLEDPIAELGAAPDEKDKIAYVVYNKDGGATDEALLVVVMNPKTGTGSEDGSVAGDFKGDSQVTYTGNTITYTFYKPNYSIADFRAALASAMDVDSSAITEIDLAHNSVKVNGDSWVIAAQEMVKVQYKGKDVTYVKKSTATDVILSTATAGENLIDGNAASYGTTPAKSNLGADKKVTVNAAADVNYLPAYAVTVTSGTVKGTDGKAVTTGMYVEDGAVLTFVGSTGTYVKVGDKYVAVADGSFKVDGAAVTVEDSYYEVALNTTVDVASITNTNNTTFKVAVKDDEDNKVIKKQGETVVLTVTTADGNVSGGSAGLSGTVSIDGGSNAVTHTPGASDELFATGATPGSKDITVTLGTLDADGTLKLTLADKS